jgi:hypothetical protein
MAKPQRVPRELPCKLTDREKLATGDELVSALVEHDDKQAQKVKITADQQPIKKLIKALQAKLKAGEETRTVLCEIHEGPGANIRIYRTDTNPHQLVEERPMTPSEAQGDWLEQTEAAVERAKGKRSKPADDDGDEDIDFGDDDGEHDNVVPFGAGRTSSKKAARKPKGPKKGKR